MSDEIDTANFGPAMAALNERQRRFVLAMASAPLESAAEWARMAGYSDKGGGAKVQASHLCADERIRAAVLEVAKQTLGTVGPMLAARELIRIASDREHRDQLKAIGMIADRVGLPEAPVQVEVTHTLNMEQVTERIAALADRLGMDSRKLLGSNVIEAEAVEVKADEV